MFFNSCCMGLLLVCVQGSTLEGWPIQMGEVQGQVLVGDLNSDGEVEIFAGEGRESNIKVCQ